MKTFVSMKWSALIHLVASELAAHVHLATQPRHSLVVALEPLLSLSVVSEPAAELVVQGRVLTSRPFASRFDEVLVRAQRNVLHVRSVHECRVVDDDDQQCSSSGGHAAAHEG